MVRRKLIGIAIEGGGQSLRDIWLKDIGQVRLWFVSAGLGGFDQAVDDGTRQSEADDSRNRKTRPDNYRLTTTVCQLPMDAIPMVKRVSAPTRPRISGAPVFVTHAVGDLVLCAYPPGSS